MNVELHDSLDGQVALVTGATRGLGRAIAIALADLGAVVYAGARETTDVTDDDLRPIRLDVTEEAQIAAAVERVRTEAGRLDVLVNNAGVVGTDFDETLEGTPTGAIDRVLATNLRGPMVVTKYALDLLLAREGSRVVNVSSGDGAFVDEQEGFEGVAGPGHPAYRVSKTGLNGLTAYLHGEYAERGLLAGAVCPGAVRTDANPDATKSPEAGAETPVWLARFERGPGGKFWRDREVIPW